MIILIIIITINTYIAPISLLLFSSGLKNKDNYLDCIKYTCIKCMNLPNRVKTILSTLKLQKLP